MSEVMQEDGAAHFCRETAAGDRHHNARRLQTQWDELGDQPYGCCEDGVKEPM